MWLLLTYSGIDYNSQIGLIYQMSWKCSAFSESWGITFPIVFHIPKGLEHEKSEKWIASLLLVGAVYSVGSEK